jgi:hypothetical protein
VGAFPIRTDCVSIFRNVVVKGGTVRWNRHITSDLCLATSWLHDLHRVEINFECNELVHCVSEWRNGKIDV